MEASQAGLLWLPIQPESFLLYLRGEQLPFDDADAGLGHRSLAGEVAQA